MKKQQSIFAKYVKWMFISSLFCLGPASLLAQTTVSNRLTDVTIPNTTTKIYVDLKGGDGGDAHVVDNASHLTHKVCKAYGGAGAVVKAVFEVGTGDNQIPPGSTLRLIKGDKGGSETASIFGSGAAGGAGGGGSAVLYREPGSVSDSDWQILAVAGGGGGAYQGMAAWNCVDHENGRGGNDEESGTSGKVQSAPDTKGGTNGNAGEGFSNFSGGGAGAFGSAEKNGITGSAAQKGYPAGGSGGHCVKCISGGYGFGAGGFSYNGPGGGGGYSGGGAGSIGYAGGGGSYLSNDISPKLSLITKGSDGGGKKEDGYINYQFNPAKSLYASIEAMTITRSRNSGNCIDLNGGDTENETNIQLYHCNHTKTQKWIFDEDYSIRYASNRAKCLKLDNNDNSNGTNIQIYDCENSSSQRWFYDVNNRFIRLVSNPKKCIDNENGSYADHNNIQLWDCVYDSHKSNMQWKVSNLPSSMPNDEYLRIHLTKDKSKCVDMVGAAAASYTNIQLYNCHTSNASQFFIFDGEQIKMQASPRYCVDLDNSKTANGTNLRLYDCNNTNAQKWIYDAVGKTFRSKVNLKKCLSIKDTDAHSGTNIHLWDCKVNGNQRFDIVPVPVSPCIMDNIPPVARCKDAHFSSLEIPMVSDINNGSTDNCEIETISLHKVSGNTYELIVTDKKNNSSSCTARVIVD